MRDQAIGLLYVDSCRPLLRYSPHHLSVMTALADQTAQALARAQKFDTYQG